MSKRLFLKSLSALTLGCAWTALAHAQAFPSKQIRLVCPFTPAGAVDIASRAIALELSKSLGVTVTVDNKPGAGGNIGGAEVARAAGARRLVLTHISARYSRDARELEREARTVFAETSIAKDGTEIELALTEETAVSAGAA